MHKKNLTNQGVVIFTIGSDYPEHNGYKFVTCVFYTEEKYKNSCQQWWNDIPESSLSDERYFSNTLGEAAEIHYKKVEAYTTPPKCCPEAQQLAKIIKEADAYIQPLRDTEDDGGTCNFDTCMIFLKGKRKSFIEQLEYLTGLTFSKYESRYSQKGWYMVFFNTCGQANMRTAMAEAAAAYLIDRGVNASVYYMID